MNARSPGYRPRQRHRRRWPAALAGLGLAALVALPIGAGGLLNGTPDRSPEPLAGGPSAAPLASAPTSIPISPVAPASDAATPAPTVAAPTPTPTPSPTPALRTAAIVPVTHFRSPVDRTSADEVRAVLDGSSERYETLELVEGDADAILGALGISPPADLARLVFAPDAESVARDLAAERKRLAFLRADEVGPSVRALGWEGTSLFGVDRVRSLDAWPLVAQVAPAGDGSDAGYDPAVAWTLVAGGDILLDRGVYKTVKLDGKGVDFPFDGGTAEITSRFCCSSFGWELPRTRRTGNGGAVRSLLEGADLAIANFENPAPNRFRFHTSGTVFTADPSLIEGLARAGIDYVSLANNHIRDAGGEGILQTIANLEERGLRHGGAGENIQAAREPAILDAGEVQVGILAYDAIAEVYAAGADRIGSAQLSAKACREDVEAARAAGADVVIVFPHWGVEYRATPGAGQRKVGQACIDAGADMIIGNHAHWAAALEVHDGRPIWYALGNFVFDQTWSEPTMEGMTLELTFAGAELRQARMRPHIILDRAQPNFLDPAGDGRVVMNQVFRASKGLLDW